MTTTTAPPPSGVRAAGETTAGRVSPGAGSGGSVPRVLAFARAVDAAFDRLGDAPAWALTPAEQRETLLVLDRVTSRLAALNLRVLVAADRNQVGRDEGATSTPSWLADHTLQTRPRCSAALKLAEALDGEFTTTGQALRDGRVNSAQARVIVRAVEALVADHDDLPPGIRARAEAHLLDLAGRFDAAELTRLGKRLFEVVCPEAADAAEGEKLAKEEERARRTAAFTMHDNGDGTVDGRFKIPVLDAELLKKALQSLTAPRRAGQARIDPRTGKKIPYPNLLGQGFLELLEHHLDPSRLPSQGGSPFTLLITLGIDALSTGIGVATIEGGARISAGEARRLACQAGIIPAVLGGPSVVLDLGREQRLFDRHQKIAMSLRYGGCAAANCDRPPAWTEAHHRHPWHTGGRTDLANGLPLCPPHHHMADHPEAWNMHTLPSGKVRFARRQ